MDVFGMGVLITGDSGVGKSELALELISRGHGLVADDVVELACIAPTTIEGRCPSMLRDYLEVRGLGCSTSAPFSARPHRAGRCGSS
jgi:HPr kinase/phosphorylase